MTRFVNAFAFHIKPQAAVKVQVLRAMNDILPVRVIVGDSFLRLCSSCRHDAGPLVIAGVLASVTMVGISLGLLRSQWVQRATLEAANTEIRAQRDAKSLLYASSSHLSKPRDFTNALPPSAASQPLLFELERTTAGLHVSLNGVQLQEHAATPDRLARTDVAIALRGSYPHLKAVILQVLGRFPNATLVQWRVRRASHPTELDANLALALWGAVSPPAQRSGAGTVAGER